MNPLNLQKIVFIFSALLLAPFFVSAAELSFETSTDENDLTVAVFANTSQQHPFNAAGASIAFDQNIFSIAKFDLRDSIFNFWTEEPHLTESGDIQFSGGTSGEGGFIWKGKLFSFTLTGKEYGEALFSFENGEILAHNGFGTNILKQSESLLLLHTKAIPKEYDTDQNGSVSLTELSIGLTQEH